MTGITHSTSVGAPRERRRVVDRQSASRFAVGWSFVGPATLIILGLSLFPAAWALVLSLQEWDGFSEATWVGIDNYVGLISDAEFARAVLNSLAYTALFVPSSVLAGVFLAVALNRQIRGVSFYRTAIFVPFVASAASTGVLSTYLFSPQFGLVNNVLRALGLPQQGWLSDPNQAILVIAIMSLWGSAAFTTVIYLAALQDIPSDLLEAARIDGAGAWTTFWRVVWPQLTPVTVFVTIWQTIQALQLFDLVYTTTKGGPIGATETIVYFLFVKAFQTAQFGYGSAAAYVLFAATLIATIAAVLISRRRGSEGI
jgi:multiple sugar transport system permease protein